MTTIALLYVTCPDHACAAAISRMLVERKLAACCNLFPGMESHYVWEGKLTTSHECAMLVKTMRPAVKTAIEAIVSMHPYECPAILEIPVDGGNPAFLGWIDTMVKTTR